MTGIAICLLAPGFVSCSESRSTTCCEEACRIWADCGWSFDACMAECDAEGDWCGSSIDCIRGKDCQQLYDCE